MCITERDFNMFFKKLFKETSNNNNNTIQKNADSIQEGLYSFRQKDSFLIIEDDKLRIRNFTTISLPYYDPDEPFYPERRIQVFNYSSNFEGDVCYKDVLSFEVKEENLYNYFEIFVLVHGSGSDSIEWIRFACKASDRPHLLNAKKFVQEKMEQEKEIEKVPVISFDFYHSYDKRTYQKENTGYVEGQFYYPSGKEDASHFFINVLNDAVSIEKEYRDGIYTHEKKLYSVTIIIKDGLFSSGYNPTIGSFYEDTFDELPLIVNAEKVYVFWNWLRTKNIRQVNETNEQFDDLRNEIYNLTNDLSNRLSNHTEIPELIHNFAIKKIMKLNCYMENIENLNKYIYCRPFDDLNQKYRLAPLEFDSYEYDEDTNIEEEFVILKEYKVLKTIILDKIDKDASLSNLNQKLSNTCIETNNLVENNTIEYHVPNSGIVINYILFSLLFTSTIAEASRLFEQNFSSYINPEGEVRMKSILESSPVPFDQVLDLYYGYLYSQEKINKDDYFNEYTDLRHKLYRIQNEILKESEMQQLEKELLGNKSSSYGTYSITDIDDMSGLEFEHFLKILFENLGYKVSLTQASQDQGIDLIIEKDNRISGVQAKNYSNAVGNKAVQEVIAGSQYYHCDESIVVTNNYFTEQARKLATETNVNLWDRDILKTLLKTVSISKLNQF